MSEVPKAKNAKKIPSNHGILFTEAVKKKKKLPKTQQIATEYFVNDCRLHLPFPTFFFLSVLNSETTTISTKFLPGLGYKSISITEGVNGFVGKTETRKK